MDNPLEVVFRRHLNSRLSLTAETSAIVIIVRNRQNRFSLARAVTRDSPPQAIRLMTIISAIRQRRLCQLSARLEARQRKKICARLETGANYVTRSSLCLCPKLSDIFFFCCQIVLFKQLKTFYRDEKLERKAKFYFFVKKKTSFVGDL